MARLCQWKVVARDTEMFEPNPLAITSRCNSSRGTFQNWKCLQTANRIFYSLKGLHHCDKTWSLMKNPLALLVLEKTLLINTDRSSGVLWYFTENGNLRAHYTKTTVRAGEVLRLVAVFQDTRRYPLTFGISGVKGTSDRDQYAQCLDSQGREIFAPLSARGEFYATCTNSNSDTDCDAVLYKVHHLAKRDLPLKVRTYWTWMIATRNGSVIFIYPLQVRLVAGPLPVPLPREYAGLMQLETATRGSIVLGCIVPERPVHDPEMLELVVSGPGAPRVRRARLGYPSEARLLASPKLQRLLAACWCVAYYPINHNHDMNPFQLSS